MIPSEKECLEILKRFKVPENIIEHSIKVKELSVKIAKKLIEKGEKINLKLLVAGALLHDVSKFDCLESDVRHGDHGCERILEIGMIKQISDIVRKHALNSILSTDHPRTWEEKIVYYADKRVNHNRIVTLKQRFDYLRKRYPMAVDTINRSYPKVVELEKELLK